MFHLGIFDFGGVFGLLRADLCADDFAFEFIPVVNRRVVLRNDDDVAGPVVINIREGNLFLALRRDVHARDGHVDLAALNRRNERIEAHALEFHRAAHFANDGVRQIDIEAHIFLAFGKFKGRIRRLRTDANHVRALFCRFLFLSAAARKQDGACQKSHGQRRFPFHVHMLPPLQIYKLYVYCSKLVARRQFFKTNLEGKRDRICRNRNGSYLLPNGRDPLFCYLAMHGTA